MGSMLKLCDILLKTGYQFKLKGWHHCVITLSCIYKLCSNQGTKRTPLLGSHFLGKWKQRLFYLPPTLPCCLYLGYVSGQSGSPLVSLAHHQSQIL